MTLQDETAAAPRTTYREVLAEREFTAVLTAWLISMLGNVLADIALSYIVFLRTGSPFQAAIAFSIGWLPHLFIGTLLSALPDRYPPRRLMISCDLVSAAIVSVMVIPGVPVGVLLVLVVLQGCCTPVFGAARAATLPDLLHGDRYILGQAMLGLVSQASLLVGYALGAGLLSLVGPRTALAIDAASFVFSALLLRLGLSVRPPRRRGEPGDSLTQDSLRGFRKLFGSPRLRSLILLGWVVPMFGVVPEALAIPLSARAGDGPSGAALILGGASLGLIVGETVVSRLLRPATRVRVMAPLALWLSVPLLLFVLRPSVPVAAALVLVSALGYGCSISQSQLLIEALPTELRGRGLTTSSSGMMLTQALGFAAAGGVAEWVAPHDVVALAGIAGLVVTGAALLAVRRSSAG
jgi:predicted MFS family arabinose efflux permease